MFWFFRGVIEGVVNRVPNCFGPIQVESRRRGDWQRGKSHPWIVCTLGFERPLKSFDKIAQEIISALGGQHGTTLRVTIDIEAERPEGLPNPPCVPSPKTPAPSKSPIPDSNR